MAFCKNVMLIAIRNFCKFGKMKSVMSHLHWENELISTQLTNHVDDKVVNS